MNTSPSVRGSRAKGAKIAFLCFDTTFFLTHLLPAVNAARASGFEIIALLPSLPTSPASLRDVRLIQIDAGRSRHPIFSLPSDLLAICAALRKCRPDVVQAFALHSCVVTALACAFVPVARKIFTVTGLGFIDIDSRWSSRIMRAFVYRLLRTVDRTGSAIFVFENAADPIRINFSKGRPMRKLTLMGAGVDPLVFLPQPLPALPPLKLALISRMIWSKGVDIAVAAVERMVERGMPIELDIYGEPDFKNQLHFSINKLQAWNSHAGIRWHGFTHDVVDVWREHHAALCPSRGGEGLPRVILEAASCGRAIIATNVPGCSDFVRPGLEGVIVEPDSVEELEGAISMLFENPSLLESMGRAARQRVVENATEVIITSQYQDLYSALSKEVDVFDARDRCDGRIMRSASD